MHLGRVADVVLWDGGRARCRFLARLLGGTLHVSVDEEACDGEASVDGKLRVARGWTDRVLPSTVRVTEAVAHRAKTYDDRGYPGEDLLEDLLGVLIGSQVHGSRRRLVEAAKIPRALVGHPAFVADVLTRAFQQSARGRDGSLRV